MEMKKKELDIYTCALDGNEKFFLPSLDSHLLPTLFFRMRVKCLLNKSHIDEHEMLE
jgi:hypothetical protein